jgi:hypothetical protein
MALKVAELFAELGVDASQLDRGVDKAVTTASRSMRQVVDAAEKAGVDAGQGLADGVTRGAQGIGADVEQRFRSETSGLADTGRQLGVDAGGGIGGGILDGLPDLGGGLEGILGGALDGLPAAAAGPALAAGAAAGAMIVQGVATSLERGGIETKLEQALGVTEAVAADMGRQAGDIYAANFGESVPQVADALASLERNTGGLSDAMVGDMGKATESVLTLSAVFDTDLLTTIRAATGMVKNGLAKDMTEALDLMTVGLQGSANAAGDLTDTLAEDSAKMRTFGLNGAESIGLIAQAMDAGAPSADFLSGMLEELAGNAADSQDTFEALGLNGEDMGRRLAGGGRDAALALDELMDALRETDDPLVRANAMVALFGEEGTAMAQVFAQLDLSSAASELGDFEGAAADATSAADDLSAKVETLKREMSEGAGDLVGGFLAPLAEAASDDATWSGMGKAIQSNVSSALELVPVGPIFKQWGDTLAGTDLWSDIFGGPAPEPPQGLRDVLADVRAAREGGDGEPLLDLDGLATSAGPAIASLDQINDLLELNAELSGLAAERADNYLQRISDSSGMDNMLASTLAFADATRGMGQWVGNLSASVDISDIADGLAGAAEDTTAVLQEWLTVGTDAQQVIADVLQFQGADQAIARADGIRAGLVKVMDQAGYTDEQIAELLISMGLMPEQVTTAIELSGADEALAKLDLLQTRFDEQIPDKVQTQIDVAVAEGRFVDAANLISLWVKDQEDGSISDPLLLSIMGDTDPAKGAVDGFLTDTNGIFATVGVGADTDPARGAVWRLLGDINSSRATIQVGAQVVSGADRIAQSVAAGIRGRRASGGPVMAGEPYLVGERGPELVIPQGSGNVIPADKTAAMMGAAGGSSNSNAIASLAAEVRALAARTGQVTVNAPIRTTAGPRETLREITLAAESGALLAGRR